MVDEKIERQIDSQLAFLHLCEEKPHNISAAISKFDGAIPIDFVSDDMVFFRNDGNPAVWPLDIKVSVIPEMNNPDWNDWPDGAIQFQSIRSISTKEGRILGAQRFSPEMVEVCVRTALPDGRASSVTMGFSRLNGVWVPFRKIGADPIAKSGAEIIPIALGVALSVRYEWSCWIGFNIGPRLRLLTDPTGAKEIFKLREIPDGRVRRAALRNWVSGHWRKKRDDPDAAAWVKKHLRGATDFEWRGMKCKIQPPQFDLDTTII